MMCYSFARSSSSAGKRLSQRRATTGDARRPPAWDRLGAGLDRQIDKNGGSPAKGSGGRSRRLAGYRVVKFV